MSTKDSAEYLNQLADLQGVAASTVSDGHVLVFTRAYLQELIDKHPDKEKLVIFIKRNEVKN